LTTIVDDLAALVRRHAQELAGAAERDQAMDAFAIWKSTRRLERRLVDLLPSAVNGRDQHGVGAAKFLHVVLCVRHCRPSPCA
jgi:hypothetical protein